jgi:alpha-ketoglutarate-dependent taurine dioxygenase
MFLSSAVSYREWRAAKLDNYPSSVGDLLVRIGALNDPVSGSVAAIHSSCKRANMAIYTCSDTSVDGAAIRAFGAHFGLRRLDHHLCANEDGVAELTVAHEDRRTRYAPYSPRSLSWHTDGYYNERSRQVRAVILHCAQNAASGGQSALLDPEIAYIRLRDENPEYVAAFEHPACMTIPANIEDGAETRPETTGPVFSYGRPGESLHMRFSARQRNIRWRDDRTTTAARAFLSELLGDEEGPVLCYDLQPGQGIISNNVLHKRTAFEDGPSKKRLLYRARFFDRIDRS